jgi:hypothetical protein
VKQCLVFLCVTAFVFFFVDTAVAIIVTNVTVAIAVFVICCCLQRHPHARMIVNLAASFILCHPPHPLSCKTTTTRATSMGTNHQRRSMGGDVWQQSNINTAKNRARGWLAEESQSP